MRLGLSLAVALLGTLHLTSSVPSGILTPSAFAVQHDLPAKVPNASAVERKNVSSSGSQKCGMSKVIVNETTVITIQKTVETKTITDQKCCCPEDISLQCKGCPDGGAKEEAPVTVPPPATEPSTSTTPQTPTVSTTQAPTVPSTRLTTPTTEPPTSPTTQAPIVQTTHPTATTITRPTSPTTQAPTVPSTRPTTATTEPSTSSTTQAPTVPTTRPTTITPKPPTSPTTQASTAPTTGPMTTATKPPTSPTTRASAVQTTRLTTTTPKPEVSATTQTAKGTELRPQPTGSPTKTCSIDNCKPPKCTCMSDKPPGGLSVGDMPQFVMLTFDDAVTKQNMQFYRELLGGLKRKNKASGCGIAATFFLSAEYLDYPSVNELYRGGNEIALHSISHNTDTSGSYWNELDTEKWEREVVDERKMVAKYANVSEDDIRGLRGPFFFTGGDAGFRMQHRHLDYDCTLIHKRDGPEDAPVFPYTLDYGFQKPCIVKECPNDSYPGLWTVPLNYLFRKYKEEGVDKYGHCAMADACTPILESSEDTFQYLRDNFENFYTTNRAPLPVFLHEAWLRDEERKKGYLRFVDWLLEKEDVHLVTVSEVLDFMRDPRPRSSYAQRRCTKDLPESTCPKTRNCHFPTTTRGMERYMNVCGTTCPTNYPWINNPDGN